MCQNVPKLNPKQYKIDQNSPNGPKWSTIFKIVQNAPIWSNLVQNCPKWSKVLLNSPKFSKIFQNVNKWSKFFINGQKWCKIDQNTPTFIMV